MNRDIEFERWVDDAKALTVEKAADLVKFEPKRGYAKDARAHGPLVPAAAATTALRSM